MYCGQSHAPDREIAHTDTIPHSASGPDCQHNAFRRNSVARIHLEE